MDDKIILYSIGCPKCKVLEKKLQDKGVEFEVCSNIDRMKELGIDSLPVLEYKGQLMEFLEAIGWLTNF